MNILQNCKRFVYTFDLFCSSELLRYKEDTQYKTFTGGLLSLGIIIVIVIGFAGMIADTFNKTSIKSDLTNIKQTNPTPLILKASVQNNFMFGLAISSLDTSYRYNMSSKSRIFNVFLQYIQFQYSQTVNQTFISLQQCTQQHWKMIPQENSKFDSFGASNTMCLPLGTNISLQGSYSAPYYSMIQIIIMPCQNTSWDQGCAPQAQIDALLDAYGNFVVNMIYVNPVINPTQTEEISYYLELNDFAIFSRGIGSQAWLQFSDYTINTDTSLLPFTNILVQTGAIALSKSTSYPMAPANGMIASLIIVKSPNSLVYNREVQKISAVFSYIGGLVGAVTAFLFMLKSYTDSSLEVTIGIDLFEESKKQKQAPSFSLMGFLKLSAYRILRMLRWKGQWKVAEKFQQYQAEAIKQLDVSILLKRLFWLQVRMNHLLSEDQPQKLKKIETQKLTVASAKKMRTFHSNENGQKESIQVQQINTEKQDIDCYKYGSSNTQKQQSYLNIFNKNGEKKCKNILKNIRENQIQSQIVVRMKNDLYLLPPHVQNCMSNQRDVIKKNYELKEVINKLTRN